MSCHSDRGRWSEEQLTAIAARIGAGEQMQALAAELGITGSGLSYVLRRHGYDTKALRANASMPDDKRQAIERRIRAGQSMREAAEAEGITYERVRAAWRRGALAVTREQLMTNNAERRRMAEEQRRLDEAARRPEEPRAQKKRARVTPDMLITAANLLRGGATYAWAAANVGCSASALRRNLIAAGYDTSKLTYPGRHYIRYTPERAKLAEKLLREGCTLTEAARQLGVYPSTLSLWGAEGRLDTGLRAKWRKLSDEQYRRIHARYMADPNSTTQELGRIYHVHPGTLARKWGELGLAQDEQRRRQRIARGVAEVRRARQPDDETLRAAWVQYRDTYATSVDMRKTLHMTWRTIKQRWRDMGLPVDRLTKRKKTGRTGRTIR